MSIFYTLNLDSQMQVYLSLSILSKYHTRDLVEVILTNLKTDSRVLFILEHSKTFQTDLWNTSLNGISYPMSLIENERL